MTKELVRLYRRERSIGNRACDAIRNARIRSRFAELESEGRVSLEIRSDDYPDITFLDQDCFADIRESEYSRANRDGCWGIVGIADGVEVDSCWGFIGEDWKDSGYDIDIMQAAIIAADDLPAGWMAL